MNLQDATHHWDDYSWDYRKRIIKIILDNLPEEMMNDDLYNVVVAAAELEIEDHFGTEGLEL
jgi:hypothetical protein